MKISKNESLLKKKKEYPAWVDGFYFINENGKKSKEKYFHPYTEIGFKFENERNEK